MKISGSYTPSINNESWLPEFLDNLAPPTVAEKRGKPLPYNDNHMLSKPFSMNELERAMRNYHNTAPGLDNISYFLIANLSDNAKYFLLSIYNDIWLSGIDIDSLKSILVVPIPKPNKNPALASSYRPISLLSCFTKTLEKMIKNRLEYWLFHRNILPENQFGFRRGFGTIDALSSAITYIQNNLTSNACTGAVCLDITGAYDCINLGVLERKMIYIGIPSFAARNITNLYFGRQVYVRSYRNERLGPRIIFNGIPQGSILSPMLFNIYTFDLHRLISPLAQVVQYADDFCFLVNDRDYGNCRLKLGTAMADISSWLKSNAFTISPEKSTLQFFSRQREVPSGTLNLAGFRFNIKDSTKYLGMIIDSKLMWRAHTTYILRSVKGALIY